jgi:hypothetical protein
MEAAQPLPEVGPPARELIDLVLADGPFLSVLLTTDPAVPNARQRSELRWKSLRSELADRGVPEDALGSIDTLVPDAHLRARTLAAYANAHGLLHAEHGHDPGDPDDHADGHWDSVPRLIPVLRWRQLQLPHVVVLIDRTGADLFGFRHEGPEEHREVDPEREPIGKRKPGGWSQRRYQQRAENSWEQGAGDVAKELLRMVKRIEPRLVVVAGDVRAVAFLRDALPDDVNELVHMVEGERPNADGSGGVPDDVDALVAETIRRQEDDLLARFDQENGQGDLAVEGPEPVLSALSKAQVEVLLIRDDPSDDRVAWFGPDPPQLGATRQALEAMGVREPREGRLRDALVRAALGTSARIHVLRDDRGPGGGVGALLRWADR